MSFKMQIRNDKKLPDKMKKHNLNLYPEISGEQYERLKEKIKTGYDKTFPVVIYEGAILDGWNRYRACCELGIQYTEKQFTGDNNAAIEFVIRSNERRDLTTSQRAALAVEYEQIIAKDAEKERCKKISEYRKTGETVAKLPPSKSRDIAGDAFGVGSKYVSEIKKIRTEKPEYFDKIKSGEMSLQDVKQEIKNGEKAIRIKTEKTSRTNDISGIDIRTGDFQKVLSDVKDIDAIITDPPYPLEYIERFSELSKYASEHLKKDGWLVVYSGQYHLPEVIERLSEHMAYVWTFCLYHVGKKQLVNGVNIMCGWKPILVFSNGRKKMNFSAYDVVISEQSEKHSHEWQQSESGVEKLIEIFSKPDDLIVDPFSGSGTFCKVAASMCRKTIGAEIQ